MGTYTAKSFGKRGTTLRRVEHALNMLLGLKELRCVFGLAGLQETGMSLVYEYEDPVEQIHTRGGYAGKPPVHTCTLVRKVYLLFEAELNNPFHLAQLHVIDPRCERIKEDIVRQLMQLLVEDLNLLCVRWPSAAAALSAGLPQTRGC